MVADEEQQQSIIQKVRDTLLAYHTRDAVRNELVSLGFDVRAEHEGAVSLENTPAEIFVQIFVDGRGNVLDSHVVTFDEIELKPQTKG
ncbi:MAG: hypothetical protein WAN99_05870 [Methanoculleus sp.]|jgi:hypothetical protein|nr:hypothetical protein [Methanomicrobiales archaeon]NQS72972.1 hypothetical protein [Methanoculleus sp.]